MTFTSTVKNTGAALLIVLTDTDSVAPGCSTSDPTLAVNATETIMCTISAPGDDLDEAALDVIHRDEPSRSN